jgi:hypothetical protein
MQIKINFTNNNTNATGIRVYRSTSIIDVNNLPAPYDSAAGNAASYTDTNVVKGQQYYYVFEAYNSTDSVRSSNIAATAAAYSGPGPQTLKAGDLSMGYYGIVQSVDFTTWDALLAWSNVTYSSKNPIAIQDWIKFAYKGKTLFTPKQPIAAATWNALYLAGLVYGTNDNGPRTYNTQTATNQYRTMLIQGSTFKVRLPTSAPAGFDLSQTVSSLSTGATLTVLGSYYTPDSYDTVSTTDLTGSEWNDLFYKLFTWTAVSQRGANWDRLDTNLTYNNNTSYAGLVSDNLFQELGVGQLAYRRGNFAANTYCPGYISATAASSVMYWRPILEMV